MVAWLLFLINMVIVLANLVTSYTLHGSCFSNKNLEITLENLVASCKQLDSSV